MTSPKLTPEELAARMSKAAFVMGQLIGHLEYNLDHRSDLTEVSRAAIRDTIATARTIDLTYIAATTADEDWMTKLRERFRGRPIHEGDLAGGASLIFDERATTGEGGDGT